MDDERRAETPPWPARLKYYLLNVPPDVRFRSWVERDMASPFWSLRAMAPMVIGYGVGGLVVAPLILQRTNEGFLLGSAIGLSLLAFLQSVIPRWRRSFQRRTLRSYERRWARQATG